VSACRFEYGTSTAYGASAACVPSPGAGLTGVEVKAAISGLAQNTVYHFRVLATNAGGTREGTDVAFKTRSAAVPIVEAVAPKGAVDITVTTLGGTSAITKKDRFKYVK